MRGAVEHAGEQRERPPPKRLGAHWRDGEDLEWFAAKGIDLVQRSPLGMQLERLHDEVGLSTGLPSTNPMWVIDYHSRTDSARARSIATQLIRASRTYRPAATVLVTYHHPIAVGCDGITLTDSDGKRTAQGRLDVGRILALYPCTETAGEARRWASEHQDRAAANALGRAMAALGGWTKKQPTDPLDRISKVMTLDGRSPADALRLMAAAKRGAKGDERGEWNRIDKQARVMLEKSFEAWEGAKDPKPSMDPAIRNLEIQAKVAAEFAACRPQMLWGDR